jgi:TonB family protein
LRHKFLFPLVLFSIIFLHFSVMVIRLNDPGSHHKKNELIKTMKVFIKEDLKVKNQIVRSEESDQLKIMDDSYLSDKNRSFKKQTKAQALGKFQKNGGVKKKLSFSHLGLGVREDPFQKVRKDQGTSSTSDYLKDIPSGDVTNLNTKEYKYFGFYERIRQKLEGIWGTSIQDKAQELFRKGRGLSFSTEYVTSLQITLDERGEIIKIHVLSGSGVQELDKGALESFKKAAPFPNPPRGLLVNGRAVLQWGFVVKN